MAGTDGQGRLFADPAAPAGGVVIDDRCVVRTRDEQRVVIVAGVVLAQYTVGDRLAEAHATVMLVEGGWADQNDVARAFGSSARTLRRNQHRFVDGGLAALSGRGGYPRGRVLPDQTVTVVHVQWHGSGVVELTYRDAAGKVAQELLYRDREPTLEVVEPRAATATDGDNEMREELM